jgi:hypothetical protein
MEDQQKRHGNSSRRLDEVIVSKRPLPGCKMQGHFVYGEINNTWIFLRVETADTLTRLWTAMGEAKTWGEMRQAVGTRLVRMLWEMTGFTQYPGDDAPFDATPIVNEYNRSWSVEQLLQITANEVPDLTHLAETAE